MAKWTVHVPYAGVLKYFNIEADTEIEAIEVVMEQSIAPDDDVPQDCGVPAWAEEEKEKEA